MATLATPEDLANVPGVDLTGHTADQVTMALEMATSEIVAELGWDPRESERVYRVRSWPYGVPIFLPAMNVTEVAAVLDGVAFEDLEPLDDWWDVDGRVDLGQAIATSGVITYTAGWFPGDDEDPSEIPQGLRDACLIRAAGLLESLRRVRSESIDDSSTTYADDGVARDYRLDQYRIMVVA